MPSGCCDLPLSGRSEALDIRAGHQMLDVAAGNGNVSPAAARRWCDVTATDYVPALLERARERAAAERSVSRSARPTPRRCPFRTAARRGGLGLGVMFTPDQKRAASEMVRVCSRGGKIGLANWTPEGFIGQIVTSIGKHLPPSAGAKSPSLKGRAGADWRAVRAVRVIHRVGAARLRISISLAASLAGGVQNLLRACAQGVCPSRTRGSIGSRARTQNAHQSIQSLRGRSHDRAQRAPRARHQQALTQIGVRSSKMMRLNKARQSYAYNRVSTSYENLLDHCCAAWKFRKFGFAADFCENIPSVFVILRPDGANISLTG